MCVAEGIHRWHKSNEGREMLNDPFRKEEREDYQAELEEAQKGWCDGLGMTERGVRFCQEWEERSQHIKVEL